MYSIAYLNAFTNNWEIAGYKQTLRGARRLAKIFTEDKRLTKDVKIYKGQPGEELIKL